jgi:membrane-associated phospholipid phosphatase
MLARAVVPGAFAAALLAASTLFAGWQFAATLTLLGLLVGGTLLAVSLISDRLYPALAHITAEVLRWIDAGDTTLSRRIRRSLAANAPVQPLLVALFVAVIAGLWAFFGILEDVVTGEPLVAIDKVAYRFFNQLRSSWGDAALVAVTEFGDAQVVIPVAGAVFAAFLALGHTRAARYLVIAFVGTSVWVEAVKWLLHRSRPVELYRGTLQFSFPSGHAAMAMTLYGLLALLLAYQAPARLQRGLIGTALSLVVLISFSRIYLGAHWLSDVLAGLTFAAAWVALLAIFYIRRQPEPLPSAALAGVCVAALLAAGALHVAISHQGDMQRYAPAPTASPQAKP